MIYRTLGRTRWNVGVVGMGCEWLDGLSEAEVCAIFDDALANGVNYLDLFMSQPTVRSHIGAALRGRRDQCMIQGHIGSIFENGQYARSRDLAKTKIAFEDLLTRLETDYIDVGMLHYVDSMADYERIFDTELLAYALELKKQGVIRCLGMSSHNPNVALRAVESGLIDVLMFSINPAYDMETPDAEIEELIEFKGIAQHGFVADNTRRKLYAACENAGVGITVMKALGAGSLLKAESSPFGKALSVVQCIHYALSRPGVASVLIGCHSVEEMHQALGYLSASDAQREYSDIFANNQTIHATGRCMYCNHCLPCPAQINIGEVTKFLDLALMQPTVPQSVKQHYLSLEKSANACVRCGSCESNCPFGVKVRENMQKAVEVFGK
ncbi:MAG: aldo/keto reductase [Clostridia bacterium]